MENAKDFIGETIKENGLLTIEDDGSSSSDEEATLKRRLAGPSVLKSGQENVNQKKINEIIYEASKGSKFFEAEQKRDRELRLRIEKVQVEVEKYQSKLRFDKAFQREWTIRQESVDTTVEDFRAKRDLTQIIVHVDCDAFYASIEELKNPKLKSLPMAVGKSVLCKYSNLTETNAE